MPSKAAIRIFSVPYFLCAKVEAFKVRGKQDFIGSRDFEDIVTVVDGNALIRNELYKAPDDDLKQHLRQEFGVWLKNRNFFQSIAAHLPNERRNAEGARKVIETLSNI